MSYLARIRKLRERDNFSNRLGADDAPYYVQLAGRWLANYRELLADIDGVEDSGPKFCANDQWYGKFKPRLERMVGWGAYHSAFKNEKAYDQCYEFAYELLPDCRGGCICFPMPPMEDE